MLDNIRIALYAVLVILAFLLYQAWVPKPATITQSSTIAAGRFVPDSVTTPVTTSATSQTTQPSTPIPALAPPVKGKLIKVTTDLFEVSIDTRGGDIVSAKLLKYPESLDAKAPFVLLNDDANTRYIAESGLLSKQGPDTSDGQALYVSPQSEYLLSQEENNLTVKLTWQKDRITVTKLFTFARGHYEIKMNYIIDNQSTHSWTGNLYTQLMRTNTPPLNHGGLVNLATYFGAAISSPQKPFEKISFKDMLSTNLNQTIPDGWAAMIQHYFISAWIPPKTAVSTYYSRVTQDHLYTIGMMGSPLIVAPGTKASTEAKLYVGPAITDQLEQAAPGLQLTIDYGWFWFISVIIFWMMQHIYDVVGNWGWSIVLVTVIIKLLFYYPSNKSYRSMSAMKKLQPKMEALKLRYGDDIQKLTQATLELYREEKVNPMSGCLPILIQIPVFIALYWVLVESVQLRQAPFIFWIRDLSQQDPYYILPVLMGISMFLQQRLNPPPPDPLQAKVMMAMPIVFTALFANFPAGLMLYWFVNNALSFLQQWHIMHKMGKEGIAKQSR